MNGLPPKPDLIPQLARDRKIGQLQARYKVVIIIRASGKLHSWTQEAVSLANGACCIARKPSSFTAS